MNDNTNPTTPETQDLQSIIGPDHTIKTTDLGEYGTTYEITRHDSDRTLHITPIEDDIIDMILYDKTGTTLAHATLFTKTPTGLAKEKLATIFTACF